MDLDERLFPEELRRKNSYKSKLTDGSTSVEAEMEWKHRGKIVMADMGNDFYLLQLNNDQEYKRVLYDGPWIVLIICLLFVDGSPILIRIRQKLISLLVCMEVDLTKPLFSKFRLRHKIWRIVYEDLSTVCFMCGCYGHSVDNYMVNPDLEATLNKDNYAAQLMMEEVKVKESNEVVRIMGHGCLLKRSIRVRQSQLMGSLPENLLKYNQGCKVLIISCSMTFRNLSRGRKGVVHLSRIHNTMVKEGSLVSGPLPVPPITEKALVLKGAHNQKIPLADISKVNCPNHSPATLPSAMGF
ncbi:hypothetical protein Tsubulata_022190 [Turnera subulata]|uniref:Zinc knuckle CX2CX4HX4C domain-containing protein n=1 Tax=Turnera subulata TaxID=218843 RepID=A0A9Q0JRP4_9ROSI|nr:hypothetical protein Tsubulata_022190 [Turnera subulata]